jgi:hypothetical protein
VFARQPCDPIPRPRDVGQWLCVPSFRMVCPYQAFTLAVNDAYFSSTQQRWCGSCDAATRVLGPPDRALEDRALAWRLGPACTITPGVVHATCLHGSHA